MSDPSRNGRRRRVLFIEANEDGSVGGSHKVLYDMLLHMDHERIEPVVMFYQDNRWVQEYKDAGWETIVWEDVRSEERAVHQSGNKVLKTKEIFGAVLRRRDFLKKARIDLVHMNNSPRTGRDTWLPAARLVGIPIVASARGDARPLPGSGPKVAVHRWLMRRFDRVATVSHYVAEGMRNQGIPAERVIVVHDGYNPKTVENLGSKSREEVRSELSVPDGKIFVIMVGNIRPWKGQHVVMEALSKLSDAEKELFHVAFIGAVRDEDQEYFAGLKTFVENEGLSEVVSFTGTRTDVPDIVAGADIALHASTLLEPGGTVVLEAMVYGAPVIAADKGGQLDYFADGTGLVFDVEQPEQLTRHLLGLAADPDRRASMVEKAKVRARDFTIEHTARKMEAIYDELLG